MFNTLASFQQELQARLARLAAGDLLRRVEAAQGIDLTSNDTLGLATHPYVRERLRQALDTLPTGAGAARLLRGDHPLFGALEARLATWHGSAAALLFPSGYSANTGLLTALLTEDDLVLSDAANHASLIDGQRLSRAERLVFPHQDLAALELGLRRPRRGRTFVVTESLFGMDGDLTPLAEICALAERHDALVIVDEAHATGVFGPRGAGRIEELGLRERVLASVHTGGKALGAAGAWVAGSRELIQILINRARSFVFTTAPQPLLAVTLDAALDLIEHEPERRQELARKGALVRAQLGSAAGGQAHIVPVWVGDNRRALELQARLQQAGFDVRAVRPPTVAPGTARLRVSVRYPVPDAELLRFTDACSRALAAMGILATAAP